MRYRVELAELLAFADKLHSFEKRAELIATRVDERVADMHTSWDGHGATGHLAQHRRWIAAAGQMRDALAQLKETAHDAHRHYTDAVQLNITMLT